MNIPLTDTTTWSLIAGVALPWLVALVNRPWWPSWARSTVAIAASVIAGLLVSLATGAFGDGAGLTVLGACGIVLVASQAVYGRLFAGSQRKLERATSPQSPGGGMPPVADGGAVPVSAGERHTYEDYDDKPGAHAEDRVDDAAKRHAG